MAAIGYDRNYAEIIAVDKSRFDDLRVSVPKQKYFGKDNLYFCGFWVSPTGQIREIASDAQIIAADISRKKLSNISYMSNTLFWLAGLNYTIRF